MAPRKKIDSNETNAYFAEEAEFGKMDANPVWVPLEPNSYSDFGGEYTLLARNPINSSRQRKKGAITDLDASGGLTQDFTPTNSADLLQGFFFADYRRKAEAAAPVILAANFTAASGTDNLTIVGHGLATGDGPLKLSNVGGALPAGTAGGTNYWAVKTGANTFKLALSCALAMAGTVVDITDNGTGTNTATRVAFVDAVNGAFIVADAAAYAPGDLVRATGMAKASNNGVRRVDAINTGQGKVDVEGGLLAENTPVTARLTVVGIEGTAGDLSVNAEPDNFPIIASTAFDFGTIGLTPGEWIYVGGDDATDRFAEAANNGWARVSKVEAHALTLDRSVMEMVDDAGTGKTVRIFFGRFLKNELGDLVKRRSYTLLRELGRPDTASANIQAEYLLGSVPSELTLSAEEADKVELEISFVSLQHMQKKASDPALPGTKLALPESDMFNTSTDIKSMRLAIVEPGEATPNPLFGYLTDFSLMINNNLSANKAIGVMGAFEVTAGTFEVSGEATAYFSTVEAVEAIRRNRDVSLYVAMAKENQGVVFDMPLLALGNGRLDVTQDDPITLPLTMAAATAVKVNPDTDYTLSVTVFDYLPEIAMA